MQTMPMQGTGGEGEEVPALAVLVDLGLLVDPHQSAAAPFVEAPVQSLQPRLRRAASGLLALAGEPIVALGPPPSTCPGLGTAAARLSWALSRSSCPSKLQAAVGAAGAAEVAVAAVDLQHAASASALQALRWSCAAATPKPSKHRVASQTRGPPACRRRSRP